MASSPFHQRSDIPYPIVAMATDDISNIDRPRM